MSQAFDTVNHYTLIEKLINTNTPNLITRFIANYIRGHKAFTQYKNKNSFKKQFKAGVPQGGVLSPTLFNIYMSDLPTPPRDIHVTTYADDITIYSSDKNYTMAQQRLQPYLEDVQTWTKANDLKLNASKTMTTLFTPDPAEYRDELSLQLDNTRLPTIRNPKILGLTFDPKLTFNEHIKTSKDKAEKTINILKALTSTHWGKNKETLTNTYKTVTRPILEYAGTIYAPIISDKQLTALQVTQNQGLRIATGCTSDTNINDIHDETKILPIEKHLRLHSSQLRQKASHPDHPLHRLTTQPQPPRLKKKTIFNNNQYTLNIDPDPTHAIDENTIKQNMKTIHTTIVQDHLSNRPINKLLNRPPPDIDKKEETLPHSTRRKLSQLRTNKSPLLMTYLHKIDPANHPAANCPLCNDPNHDSLHLFNCPDIPTTLTVWDLWTNPMGVAALLDVWGEKLGGPRAGVWDPVRAHARDGVDTTTPPLLSFSILSANKIALLSLSILTGNKIPLLSLSILTVNKMALLSLSILTVNKIPLLSLSILTGNKIALLSLSILTWKQDNSFVTLCSDREIRQLCYHSVSLKGSKTDVSSLSILIGIIVPLTRCWSDFLKRLSDLEIYVVVTHSVNYTYIVVLHTYSVNYGDIYIYNTK